MLDYETARAQFDELLSRVDVPEFADEGLASKLALTGTAILGLAAGARRPLLALPALAALLASHRVALQARERRGGGVAVVARATQQAELGRKLAIYERETGLLAYWFLALRGDEECARSSRYGDPLTLLVADCDDEELVQDPGSRARAISMALRTVDIISYVGNGRFIAILPSTPVENVVHIEERLSAAGFGSFGCAAFGRDGRGFDDLYRSAAARVHRIGLAKDQRAA